MSRCIVRGGMAAILFLSSISLFSPGAQAAAVSASIVPGTFTQGSVQASLGAGTSYANAGNTLNDWWSATSNLTTTTGTKFAISMTNGNFNATLNNNATILAFG